MTRALSLGMLASCLAFSQTTSKSPSFEVASVRVSQIGKTGGEGSRRETVQFSPDSVTLRNASFRTIVRWAFQVFDYQVTGPDWITSERYDVTAKSASQVTEEQLRDMVQTLLAERFKMEFHRQTKEMSAFVLSIAKGGLKVKESAADGEMVVDPQKDRLRVVIQRAPISQLIDGLTNMLRAPIIDETGLKGKYDVTIDASKYMPQPGDAPPDPIAIITMGLQQELGLKLESRKVNVDLVVVDRAEKLPSEN